MAARCYTRRQGGGWIKDHEVEVETARLANRAAELGKDDAVALCTAGVAFSFMVGDHATGKLLTDRALALNPSLALAWLLSGWVRVWLGEFEEVVDRISRSLRLNPADPHSYSMHSAWPLRTSLLAAIPRLCLGRKWLCERNPPIFLQLA